MDGSLGGRPIFVQVSQASQPNPAYRDLSVVGNKIFQVRPRDRGITTGSFGFATPNFSGSPVFVQGFGHRSLIDSKTSDCSIKIFELKNILFVRMASNRTLPLEELLNDPNDC